MPNLKSFDNTLIEAFIEYFDSESSLDFFAQVLTPPANTAKDRALYERDCLVCGIHIALEGKPKQRELVSKLLVDASIRLRCISRARVAYAFDYFLENPCEAALDNPREGAETLAKLIARSVSDEVLQPSYISSHPLYEPEFDLSSPAREKKAAYVLKLAWDILHSPHGMVRLDYIWENYSFYPGNKTIEEVDEKLRVCILEFLDAHDFAEVKQEIRDMNADDLNFEWVYQILLVYLHEKSYSEQHQHPNHAENCKWLICLLQTLLSENQLTLANFQTALQKVKQEALFLDYPNFTEAFSSFSKAIVIK